LRVGALTGEAVQPDWALFSRRRRSVQVVVATRRWRYRVVGLTSSSGVEREDATPVATRHAVFGTDRIARSADDVEVAMALLLFVGVPVSELTVQK